MLNVRHTKAAAKIFRNNKNDTKRAVVAANLRPPLRGGGSCFLNLPQTTGNISYLNFGQTVLMLNKLLKVAGIF